MTAAADHLTLHVARDDGDEGNGTEIVTYEAAVTPHQRPRGRRWIANLALSCDQQMGGHRG